MEEEEEEVDNSLNKATCSVSSFNTYKSAIKDLYTEQRLAMKAELNRELIDLSNCYRKLRMMMKHVERR